MTSLLGAARDLIRSLDALRDLADAGDLQQIKAALASGAPALTRFITAANDCLKGADSRIRALKNRVDQLATTLAELKDEIDNTAQTVAKLKATYAATAKKKSETESMIAARTTLETALTATLQAHKAKLEEFKKWCWVPIYGQVLAVQCLVDDDIGALQACSTALQQARGNENDLRTTLASLTATLTDVTQQLDSSRALVANDDALVDQATADVATAKARTAFLQDATRRMRLIVQFGSDVAKTDLSDLTEALDDLGGQPLDKDDPAFAGARNAFESGLLHFALAIDENADYLTFSPTTANVVIVNNPVGASGIAAEVQAIGVVGGHAAATPWTSYLSVGQSARIDLRDLGVPPATLVRISAHVLFGPTLTSGSLMFVDGSADVICELRLKGTVFDPSIVIMT